jgi:carbamate kinase
MRLVIALGGNALLRRGEALSAENQRRNMRAAANALAKVCDGNEVVIVHGNGPQVGLLALEADAYKGVAPYPLDMLGAESQGMIGYVIAQELRNARPDREVVTLLTQTLVSLEDQAFRVPTKPIGPDYTAAEAEALRATHGWVFVPDGVGLRRVVASPQPVEIVEMSIIKHLLTAGVVTVCAGGGGVPVHRTKGGALEGIEAVIDKDLTAALLAEQIAAERLVILTDVDAVYLDWGTPAQRVIRESHVGEIELQRFSAGSMGPKVEAACRFVNATGRRAAIGSLGDTEAVVTGRSGTNILP